MLDLDFVKTNYPYFIGSATDNINCVVPPRNREGKCFCDAFYFPIRYAHLINKISNVINMLFV